MTITKASAQLSLLGTATPTRTNVTNSVAIGSALATKSFSDANIVYSFNVVATGTTDVATLTIATGDVAQTTGTPTISDSGVDFEGNDIGTAAKLYALQVEQTVDGDMALDGHLFEFNNMAKAGDKALFIYDTGLALSSQTLIMDLNATGVACKVTVIGKTS